MKTRYFVAVAAMLLSAAANAQELMAVKCANGKYGYRDELTLKWYLQPQYDGAADFVNGVGIVTVSGKTGLIDAEGKYVVSPKYDTMEYFDKTFYGNRKVQGYIVSQDGRFGVIDLCGTEVIPCVYDEINKFLESLLIVVKKNGKYGAIDLSNVEIIPCVEKSASDVLNGKKWGKAVLQADAYRESMRYDAALQCFEDSYNKVSSKTVSAEIPSKNTSLKQEGSKYGVFDEDAAKWIVVPAYEMAYDAYNCYIVQQNGKFGIVDKQGVKTVACEYDEISINGDEALVARKNGKFQLIDLTGRMGNFTMFDMIGEFTGDGVAPVSLGGKYAVISDKGKLLTGIRYDKIEEYKGGVAKFSWKGYEGTLNIEGKEFPDILKKLYAEAFRAGTIDAYKKFMELDDEGRFKGDCYREMGTINYNNRNDKQALENWELALKYGVENAADVENNINRLRKEMMDKR